VREKEKKIKKCEKEAKPGVRQIIGRSFLPSSIAIPVRRSKRRTRVGPSREKRKKDEEEIRDN